MLSFVLSTTNGARPTGATTRAHAPLDASDDRRRRLLRRFLINISPRAYAAHRVPSPGTCAPVVKKGQKDSFKVFVGLAVASAACRAQSASAKRVVWACIVVRTRNAGGIKVVSGGTTTFKVIRAQIVSNRVVNCTCTNCLANHQRSKFMLQIYVTCWIELLKFIFFFSSNVRLTARFFNFLFYVFKFFLNVYVFFKHPRKSICGADFSENNRIIP